jgi:predicted Fe-S protein YdhL (DUF1289 family)
MSRQVATPCTGVCCMDNETGLCKGCYRTLQEITNWVNYTDQERLEVIEDLKHRERKFG